MSVTVILRVGEIEVDVLGHRAAKGRPLRLTGREFDLLAFLQGGAAQEGVGWSYGDQSTVTVHERRLREKIEADAATSG